ncbi:MAG: N-acetylmuramoyl-L-alanine amidase, partial [Lachnospiraceae bacterium]|nr:N-acetylmuramoyl-L-alanine amidase [Lachnospiraceae bacterium]
MTRYFMRKNRIILGLMALLLWAVPSLHLLAAPRAQTVDEEVVVVIDAGHGGENLGAKDYGRLEKELTLVTAQAMYDALIQYDGVKVYMTRTADTDLSLEQRAQFAKDVQADFLFSVHYNASDSHRQFGSEVLV